MNKRYDRFLELTKEIYKLDYAMALLSWDQKVMMPPKGAMGRAEIKSALAGMSHNLVVNEELFDLVADDEGRRTHGRGSATRGATGGRGPRRVR